MYNGKEFVKGTFKEKKMPIFWYLFLFVKAWRKIILLKRNANNYISNLILKWTYNNFE